MLVTIIILAILLITTLVAVVNLIKKVESYEDVVNDHVVYLNNISKAIYEGRTHLQTLDSKGTFQSDDEVGEYFKQMQEVQKELDRYMLPQNYGKKEE